MTADGEMAEPLVDTFDLLVLGAVLILTVLYFVYGKNKNSTNAYVKATNGATSAAPATNGTNFAGFTSFVDKMKAANKDIVIFYGSQTGTAEEFASRLASEAKLYGFNAMTADLEEYEMDDLERMKEIENGIVIFSVATYGEGDPTDNAIEFHQWLKDGCNGVDLSELKYTVFSLGNSTYEHYQAMGRFVDKVLTKMGAQSVFKRGEGDDDKNIEEDFCQWKKELWPALCAHVGKEVPKDVENAILARQYRLVMPSKAPAKVYTGEHGRHKSIPFPKSFVPDLKNPMMVPVTVNRELFSADGERSCRHVELDITGTNIKYTAGDHVAIYPTNNPDMVKELAQRLEVDLDTVFSLEATESNKKAPFPVPCTFGTALGHYLDISQLPKPHHLKELSQYAEGEDKEFLLRLASDAGHDEYTQFIQKDMRTFAELIRDVKTLKPDVGHVMELLPKLQPRYYSISSSPKAHPKSIHVTAVVVEYETPLKRHAKGVCTTYLRGLDCSDPANLPKVPIYVRQSNFKLPRKLETPIVMVGPGTGLAPFRGFVQDREADLLKGEGQSQGDVMLYYGCRRRDEDFLYQDEIMRWKESGVITHLELAFSREQAQKVYVTHLLRQNKAQVWDCIHKGGYVYVCGEAKNMARDVHTILHEIVQEFGGMGSEEAESFIQDMQAKGRYAQDVWS